ncbi:MAG: hypothetical protein AB1546_05670, partial [bacterium]
MQGQQKVYTLRKVRQRQRRRLMIFSGILVFLLLAATLYGVLQMECWKVKVMEVSGVERIDPEKVYRETNISLGDHMLLLSTAEIEHRLMR